MWLPSVLKLLYACHGRPPFTNCATLQTRREASDFRYAALGTESLSDESEQCQAAGATAFSTEGTSQEEAQACDTRIICSMEAARKQEPEYDEELNTVTESEPLLRRTGRRSARRSLGKSSSCHSMP